MERLRPLIATAAAAAFAFFSVPLVPASAGSLPPRKDKVETLVDKCVSPEVLRAARSDSSIQATLDDGLPPANGWSESSAISDSGRYVAFQSASSNLLDGNTALDSASGFYDIFVTDRYDGSISLISVNKKGVQGQADSIDPAINSDGRYTAFTSGVQLTATDTNAYSDVFVYDRTSLAPELLSLRTNGTLGNSHSNMPDISDDGTVVAFASSASTLVPSDTNGDADIFVRDRVAGTTTRISVSSTGAQANNRSTSPAISANGNWITYSSRATNLLGSGNDTNGLEDVFLYNRSNGNTTRLSVRNNSGNQAIGGNSIEPAISSSGRYVAFASEATNLVPGDAEGHRDVFVRDRTAGTTDRVSKVWNGGSFTPGNGSSGDPAISEDGDDVAFESDATNLGVDSNGYTDIFEFELSTGVLRRLSSTSTDQPAVGGASTDPALSSDAMWSSFTSAATNLDAEDLNGWSTDVFTHTWTSLERTNCQTAVKSRTRRVAAVIWQTLAAACFIVCDVPQPPPTNRQNDDRCVNVGDSPAGYDSASGSEWAQMDAFSPVFNPIILAPDTAPLLRGEAENNPPNYTGWGYRHIKAKHGWGPSVRAIVHQALTLPNEIRPNRGSPTSRQYHLQYGGEGVECHAMVVVEWKAHEGDVLPYYIITAYIDDLSAFPFNFPPQ